jgi:hypothetical protein
MYNTHIAESGKWARQRVEVGGLGRALSRNHVKGSFSSQEGTACSISAVGNLCVDSGPIGRGTIPLVRKVHLAAWRGQQRAGQRRHRHESPGLALAASF